MKNINIRIADISDAEELLGIYAPYVTDTAVSFEYEVPSLREFSDRIYSVLQKYPYLVAEEENGIIGYAYASPFKQRAAYDRSVETSIYVKKGYTGKGCGGGLYRALEEILKSQNILNLNACIAYIETEDAHLTNNSMHFHEHMGYRLVGKFNNCGYKFGKWYDMIWMEKIIGEHVSKPEQFCPFSRMDKSLYNFE